jgi:hypothetical protein
VADIIKNIISVFFILLLNPYGIGVMVIALFGVIIVAIYFRMEAVSMSKRLVLKRFYCPFRRKMVEVKLLPSIFKFRVYDDVINCSAFNSGKVTCRKNCLGLPVLQN